MSDYNYRNGMWVQVNYSQNNTNLKGSKALKAFFNVIREICCVSLYFHANE